MSPSPARAGCDFARPARVTRPLTIFATWTHEDPRRLADLIATVGDVEVIRLASLGDTNFEELTCLGLNPNPTEEALIGTLTVKLPNGYSGGLCGDATETPSGLTSLTSTTR